jgi:hypothetical protein
MKTKDKYKKSLSRAVRDQTPTARTSNGDNFLVDAKNNGINSVSIDLPNMAVGNPGRRLAHLANRLWSMMSDERKGET